MIAQLIFGAEGTLRQLGLRMGIISLALAGGCSVLILAPGVSKPGEIGAPEQATASLACLFFAAFTVMFLYTTVWDRWESRFDTMPWSDAKLSGKGESGRRASTRKGPCPFTGLATSMRCPCCKAAVHETAFHRIDKKTAFVVGETVLKWDLATTALHKTHQPVLSRIELDEALDFNGNIIFGAIGNACIGCTAWQRSFNVMARWSLTLACMSQWFCWAPWAFQESIATVKNGKSLQWVMLLISLFSGIWALAIEVRRLLLAVIFQSRYAHMIKFPGVITLPTSGWRRRGLELLVGPSALK